MTLLTDEVTPTSICRVLLAGFLLVSLLLVAAGLVGIANIRSIRESAARLAGQDLMATRLLEDVQREQAALTALFHKLSRGRELVHREEVLAEPDEADDRLEEISLPVKGSPEEPLWNELKQASNGFSAEARRLLAQEAPGGCDCATCSAATKRPSRWWPGQPPSATPRPPRARSRSSGAPAN